jgi:multiple sugar transport system substrate-binding protein
MKRQLKGITWNHTRGYLPLVATAQVFMERHAETEISWTVRSLQAFADEPIEKLAKHYDLLVIDHPFTGRASRGDVLLPIDELLPSAFLEDQAKHSVGRSHESYQYGGHQWALAIDAATPIAGWSGELKGEELPGTWHEVIDLARGGMVAFLHVLCRAGGRTAGREGSSHQPGSWRRGILPSAGSRRTVPSWEP